MSDPRYGNIGPKEVRLMEECGELIQAVSKAVRFGYRNWDPNDPTKETNIRKIFREYNDVRRAFSEIHRAHKEDFYYDPNKDDY